MGINSNNWYDETEESKRSPQESKETLEQKDSSLSISDEGNIVMTVIGEDGKQKTMPLREFLDLTSGELKEELTLLLKGFTLIGVRMVQGDRSWYPEWFERFTKEYGSVFIPQKGFQWFKRFTKKYRGSFISQDEFEFSPREQSGSRLSGSKDVRVDLVFAKLDISKIIGMLRKDFQEGIERESLLRGMTSKEIMLSIMAARIYKSIWIKDFEKDIQTYKDKDLSGEVSEEVSRIKKLEDFELLDIFLRKLAKDSKHFPRLYGDLIKKLKEEVRRRSSDVTRESRKRTGEVFLSLALNDKDSIKKLQKESEEFTGYANDTLKICKELAELVLHARVMQTQSEITENVFSILDKRNTMEDVLGTSNLLIPNFRTMGINSNNCHDETEESKKSPQESKETLEQKGLSLSISDEGSMVMTITGEDGKQKTMPLREFLDLTSGELKKELTLLLKGFTLIGVRMVQGDRSWYPEWFERFTKEYEDLFAPEKKFRFLLREQSGSRLSGSKDVRVDLVFAKLDISKIIGMLRKDFQEGIERESLRRGMTREGIMLSIMAARVYRLILIENRKKRIQMYKEYTQRTTGIIPDPGYGHLHEIRKEIVELERLGDFELLGMFLIERSRTLEYLERYSRSYKNLLKKYGMRDVLIETLTLFSRGNEDLTKKLQKESEEFKRYLNDMMEEYRKRLREIFSGFRIK